MSVESTPEAARSPQFGGLIGSGDDGTLTQRQLQNWKRIWPGFSDEMLQVMRDRLQSQIDNLPNVEVTNKGSENEH